MAIRREKVVCELTRSGRQKPGGRSVYEGTLQVRGSSWVPSRKTLALFISAFLRYEQSIPFVGESSSDDVQTRIVALREVGKQKFYFRAVTPAMEDSK